jgi:iron-sulfur cluster assembly protein
MISISDKAKSKILSLFKEEGISDAYVKVSIKSGGCSGLSYDLKFTNKSDTNDKILEDNEIKILIDKKSLLYIAGTTLDFSGGLNGKGFVFNNPNAKRTCGCGESFAI